jgi:hypothetical protein
MEWHEVVTEFVEGAEVDTGEVPWLGSEHVGGEGLLGGGPADDARHFCEEVLSGLVGMGEVGGIPEKGEEVIVPDFCRVEPQRGQFRGG